MLDTIEYVHERGRINDRAVTVYALSTCGFCKRALSFLKEKEVAHRFIYIDNLPPDTKAALKEALRAKFSRNLVFPFLVIDETQVLSGFVRERWEELLGVR